MLLATDARLAEGSKSHDTRFRMYALCSDPDSGSLSSIKGRRNDLLSEGRDCGIDSRKWSAKSIAADEPEIPIPVRGSGTLKIT